MFIRFAAMAATVCFLGGQGAEILDKYRDGIHNKVNELRAKGKLDPLTRNAELEAAAQKHAENMAKHDKYSHELDGKRSADRLLMEGYAPTLVAENIAQATAGSNKSAAAVVDAWRYSPGHYKNIMHEQVTETGIGVAKSKSGKWYFCQVFAAPKKK
jgi:uncharacterized protein YkwD